MRYRFLLFTFLFILSTFAVSSQVQSLDKPLISPGYIDVHMHFTNQIDRGQSSSRQQRGSSSMNNRRGPGRRPPMRVGRSSQSGKRSGSSQSEFSDKDYAECADNMIKIMDKYNIDKAVVMPQPRIEGQFGYYDFRKIKKAIAKHKDRLLLGGGGGKLNSMIHGIDPGDVSKKDRREFKKEALAIVKAGAVIFGELATLHVSLQPKHVFEEAAPDHPLLLDLADIAAEHGLPIDIHMEAVEKDTVTPSNLRKISTKNPSKFRANIPAFKRMLNHNKKANVIWQHIGWDNIGQMTIELLTEMLEDHPNLYLGFKIEERPFQIIPEKGMEGIYREIS
ncbi:MAG: amidohydrolase family protein [Planctomycetota bacterium]|jgi:hypothetical protein